MPLLVSWYLPAAQAVQSDAPPVGTLPTGQGVQKAAPLRLYMDAGHGAHSSAHAPAYEPAAQGEHLKLPAVEKLPAPLFIICCCCTAVSVIMFVNVVEHASTCKPTRACTR